MSYTSESTCGQNATLSSVRDLVALLGYRKVADGLSIPNRKGSYMWFETRDYKSHVGVELSIYQEPGSAVTVSTRSRVGRSYWDLIQQNRTIKILRNLLGGSFSTDAGDSRYWHPEGPPLTPVGSGCYLARWRFNNALIKPKLYLDQRGLNQENAKPVRTGLDLVDELNPRLFSNNLVLPYLVAIWEEYFKSSFVAIMRYSVHRSSALKKARLSDSQLEVIASEHGTVEEAVAEAMSFQHPSNIAANFKLIDPKLDLATELRRRYRNRKQSLFDSIGAYVTKRHELVHTGSIDLDFSDTCVKTALENFEVSVERCYKAFGRANNFTPLEDF
jgi:hypothetical protein